MGENYTLGMDCKLYYGDSLVAGGGPAAVSWNEIDNCKDLTLGLETGEANITTRGNNGWRATAATLKDGSIEFEMLWKPGDGAFDAIQAAWAAAAEISIAALDGDIAVNGQQGLAGNFSVTNFSRNEPMEEGVTVNVTLKPSSYTQWYTVGA